MKRSLLVFLLLAVFVSVSPISAFIPNSIASVRPLTQIHGERLRSLCTTSSINQEKHYWITAEHCAGIEVDAEGNEVVIPKYIDGDEVKIVMRDILHDVAILHTKRASAPAIGLSPDVPVFRQEIFVIGYPMSFPDAIITKGIIAHPSTQFTDEPPFNHHFMLLNVTAAPGNSGSPVLDVFSEMVSIVQIVWGGHGFSNMTGGVPWDVLNTYRNYWEAPQSENVHGLAHP